MLAAGGPLLLVPNHDSQWDPIVAALAARKVRKLRFLARADLWKSRILRPILGGLHQIPIERGVNDSGALDQAVTALREGEAVCVFPEGRLSLGRKMRARSGVGRLAAAVPQARVVCCALVGTTDYVRTPRRPRVRVEFFEPVGGPIAAGEDPGTFAARLLAEIRDRVPPSSAGRDPERLQKRLQKQNPNYKDG